MSAFSISRRCKSIGYALQGAGTLVRTQHNAWIHSVATIAVIFGGVSCHITRQDWALLILAVTIVWVTEALNTAIEFLADEVSEETRDGIGKAKDIGAFAVLVGAVASTAIGGIVFMPHFFVR